MTARAERLEAFLAGAGWGGAARAPLAGDASNRRYLRLGRGRESAVLMDAPPERGEDVRPFLDVTRRLRAAGLSAPAILAAETDHGFVLLEDLGDALFARVCERGDAPEADLYAAAVDLLAGHAEAIPAGGLPDYDRARLAAEAGLAPFWYLAGLTGAGPSPDLAAEFEGRLVETLAPVLGAAPVAVMRDYHAENLVWLPSRRGAARVGLLDYQDAVRGHPAYDLVSLLEDARRDTGAELREAMTRRYLDRRPGTDGDGFRAALAILGAQRNLKILGIFARLCLRDGKPRYLDMLPRVWGHLARDLAHPATAPLAGWVRERLPEPGPAALRALAARAGEAA